MSLLTASACAAKASLASTRSRSRDLPAGLLERLAGGRDRARAHDGRIDAGGRPGGDAGERREAALLGLGGRHQHERGGAVVDARRVAGRHRAVLREGGPAAWRPRRWWCRRGYTRPGRRRCRPCGSATVTGDDLVLEPAGLLGGLGLVLRGGGELVLLLAGELPLAGRRSRRWCPCGSRGRRPSGRPSASCRRASSRPSWCRRAYRRRAAPATWIPGRRRR